MAVTRRGGRPAQGSGHSKRTLGRVLVTIDDLDALLALLADVEKPFGPSGGNFSHKITIEFIGGSIDDPQDLKKLSDQELETLIVKSPHCEIVLTRGRAVAVGASPAVSAVYERWAKSRQCRIRPGRRPKLDVGLVLVGMLSLTVGVASGVAWLHTDRFPAWASWSMISGAAFAGISSLYLLFSLPSSFAAVRATTLEQYRQDRATSSRHLITVTIALASVVVALTGIIAGVLFKK